MFSKVSVLDGAVMKKSKRHCTGAPQSYRITFLFYLFRDVSGGAILFESVFGRPSSNKSLRSRRFRRKCHEKIPQTTNCTGVSPESPSTAKNKFARFGTHQRIYGFPPDQVSGAAARNHPSTRAGGQDDGSLNKLPQTKILSRAEPYFLRPCVEGSPSEMLSKVSVLGGAVLKESNDPRENPKQVLSKGIDTLA